MTSSHEPRQAAPPVLQKYDYYLGPKALGDVWTLTRGPLKLRCALATHRLGWELRLTAGANFLRSQICKSEQEVSETQTAWRAEAITKGWSGD
jgi:hypothetical protein